MFILHKIHYRLLERFAFYRKWHINPRYTFWNFLILAIISLIVLAMLILAINSVYTVTVDKIFSPRTEAALKRKSTAPDLKFAFFADQTLSENAKKVLRLVREEGADAAIIGGDFDQQSSPDIWNKMLYDELGAAFPVFAVLGNHELTNVSGYQTAISNRLASTTDARCQGTPGIQYACDYKGLFAIFTTPNVVGAGHAAYIRDELAKNDKLWKICIFHKNQRDMQVVSNSKSNETGWDVYEACREGGAIVVTGQGRAYSRSYLMDNFAQKNVVSLSPKITLEKGRSFTVVSGLGGKAMEPQRLYDSWWASTYTSNQVGTYGALFCTFYADGKPDFAKCYFKNIRGEVIDQFEMTSKVE